MHPSFKCSEDLKTHVPEAMKDAVQHLASEAGCEVSELLRDMVCLRLHGVTFGEYVANHRRAVLMPQGPHPGHDGAKSC